MVQGYTTQGDGGGCVRPSFPGSNRQVQRGRTKTERRNVGGRAYIGGSVPRQGNLSYGQLKRLIKKLEGLCWKSMNSAGFITCVISMT